MTMRIILWLALGLLFAGPALAQLGGPTLFNPGGQITGGGGPPPPTVNGVINANNPTSAPTLRDVNGDVWSFNCASSPTRHCYDSPAPDGFGDWPVLRNGIAADPGNGCWQLQTDSANAIHCYYIASSTWYARSGSSWTATGSAPPASSSFYQILEIYPANVAGDAGFQGLVGQLPNSAGGLPYGPLNYYNGNSSAFYSSFPNLPINVSYNANICATGKTGNNYCTCPNPPCGAAPNTALYPDWVGIACGAYDSQIHTQLQTYMKPNSQYLYYVRIDHENFGSFQQASPFYGSTETAPLFTMSSDCPNTIAETPQYGTGPGGTGPAGRIPPSIYVAGERHLIALWKSDVINCGVANGCNPKIKISCPAPSDAIQATYYSGDDVCDILDQDLYIGSSNASNSLANWLFYQHGTGGFASNSYIATFAAQHNKPLVYPEWCDFSQSPNEVDGVIIKQFTDFFASLGSGLNPVILGAGYWNENSANGGFECPLWDTPAKATAYQTAYNGKTYTGKDWLQTNGSLIPMPTNNPWQTASGNQVPTSIGPSSVTIADSVAVGQPLATLSIGTSDGKPFGGTCAIPTNPGNLFVMSGVPADPCTIKVNASLTGNDGNLTLGVTASEHATTVSQNIVVTISAQVLTVVITPTSATEACNAAGNTNLATVKTVGGNGSPVTLSILSGAGLDSADAALSTTTPPANLNLASGGFTASNTKCPLSGNVTTAVRVQATQ